MKTISILTIFLGSVFMSASAQNVGIGTTTPAAGLHVESNNSILVKGALNLGVTLNESGTGTRFIFNSRKGAIRGGYLTGTGLDYWNDANTGFFSTAFGSNVKASGFGAIALGQLALATATNSTAIGYACTAEEPNTIAISGASASAKSQYSVAIGNDVYANTYASLALGRNVNAGYQVGFGQNCYAIGVGDNTNYAAGGHYATGSRAFVFGNSCSSVADRSFSIGNDCSSGADFYNRSQGVSSFAFGNSCIASGNNSFALGNSSIASGIYSFALGNNANTNGKTGSMVLGSRVDGVTVLSPANYYLLAQFAGGYQMQTNNAGTLGVYLNPNSSSWLSLCDSTRKEQVLPTDDDDILKKLSSINYSTWKYKDDPDAANRHYGIMAQDFYSAFGKDDLGQIGTDSLVNPIDLIGVAYSAIKSLNKKATEIEVLKNQNEQLQARLERLEGILLNKK